TRDIRYAHDTDRYTTGPYSEEEFLNDIMRVTGGETNERLAKMLVHSSLDVPGWMEDHGVIWKKEIRGTLHLGRTNAYVIGGGKASGGSAKQAHMVAVDARAPKFDGGITTRVDSIPFGIVVNKLGKRFYDEGEEEWPKRYAIWGKLIAEQPDQVAYSIFDSSS